MNDKSTPGTREEETGPEQTPRPWRSLLALTGGLLFLIFLAILMIWLGSLIGG